MQIRMGMVDGHTLVREGFRAIVQLEDDMEIIFESDRYKKAKAFLDGSAQINILIVDISMQGQAGFELIKMANRKGIKSIVVNLDSTGPHILEAKRAGASGYISKGCSASELLAGIRAVHNNQVYHSKDVKKYLASSTLQNPFVELTTREIDICRHILDGVKIKRIANLLNISPKTVYVHKANAYRKLNVNSTQSLFQLAKENGVKGYYQSD